VASCRALGGRLVLRLALRPELPYRQTFFESLLLFWVGFLMPRASRLELDLPAPEELTDTIGVRVLDAALAQEPMSLPDRCYLSVLHGLLEFFEGFLGDQLLATAFVYPLPGWSILLT
jgi:hypothetical protein